MDSKVIGATFIVSGTVIGAGMLGIPLATSGVGFAVTLIELVFFFVLMILPALAIAELSQFAPPGTSMPGLCRLAWGKVGFIINNIAFILLAYSLASAYLNGTYENIVEQVFTIPAGKSPTFIQKASLSLIIGLVYSCMVVFSQRTADLLNRVFFYILLLAFFAMVVIGLGFISLTNLEATPVGSLYVLKSIPVLFLAFGFQFAIPSLIEYLDHDIKALKTSLWLGLIIPSVILVLWCLVVHGNASQAQLTENGGNVNIGQFLYRQTDSVILKWCVKIFSVAALATSFIGIGLSLVTTFHDYLRASPKDDPLVSNEVVLAEDITEVMKLGKVRTRAKPWQTFLFVFVVPTFVIIFFPQFLNILYFATFFFTIQCISMPCFALYTIRKRDQVFYNSPDVYRLNMSTLSIWIMGVVCIILALFGFIPL